MTAIESEVSRALQKSASKFVDERIVGLIDKMAEEMPNNPALQPTGWLPQSRQSTAKRKNKQIRLEQQQQTVGALILASLVHKTL